MIDVSGIEYDFLPGVLWTVPFIVAGVLLITVANKHTYRDWAVIPGVIGGIALIWGGLVGPLVLLGMTPSIHVQGEEKRNAIEQLSDQGYSRVDLDWEGKTFTASVDGEYFEGLLHPVGDYKYQVLTVEEVQP